MEVFRITTIKWANSLTPSGLAARWNSGGVSMIYAASSRSLACLENVVHRNKTSLTDYFRVMVIYIPDSLKTDILQVPDLPDGWYYSDETAYEKCRVFGNKWINSHDSAVLKVPSAIVKNEFNILINPLHKDFQKIKQIDNEPFFFDPRIK